ncbi:MAG: metallophosphoesterase [Negativicutes bacterium]|nr:metallophosphoesterase [Negativicutes bacterium]
MRFLLLSMFILTLTLIFSWINIRFLARWFPAYRRGGVRYGYLSATIAACSMIVYGWSLRSAAMPWPYEGLLYLAYTSFAWVISQIFLLLFLPVLFLLQRQLQHPVAATNPGTGSEAEPATGLTPDPTPVLSRRRFLQGALAAAPVLALGGGGEGVYAAAAAPVVRRFHFAFADAPAGLTGFKLAQISDIHLGSYFSLDQFARVLAAVGAERPDLVVLSGDFVDDLSLLTPSLSMLAELQPAIPHGVYFCWGNHEYFRNLGRIRRELAASPITLLENSSALILPGERPFYLLGVDYPWVNTTQNRRLFLDSARRNLPPGAFTVLAAHHPDFLFEGFADRIPLTLTGHTHGGQVVLGGRTVLPFPYHYIRGLYQENQVYGYVNSGVGHWLPFRLGCPPEISVFTLSSS